MNENGARAVATAGIWASLACALIFGVFRINWTGETALIILVLIIAILAAAAAGGTAAVWAKYFKDSKTLVPPSPDDKLQG